MNKNVMWEEWKDQILELSGLWIRLWYYRGFVLTTMNHSLFDHAPPYVPQTEHYTTMLHFDLPLICTTITQLHTLQ